jgi:hypothetical protein
MPDRLPSLVLLVGFWIPPVVAGRAAADLVRRTVPRASPARVRAGLAAFVVAWAAVWFLVNLSAMPPYIPGAKLDPTVATPQAIGWLALVTAALVLPGSAIACALAFRRRARALPRTG